MTKSKCKQIKKIATTEKSQKYVLVTDARYQILLNIFETKCIGEVSFESDEDEDENTTGSFLANKGINSKYAWDWADKISYTYSRLTSMIGYHGGDRFFENEVNEYIYIFKKLDAVDFEIISHIIKDHYLLFKYDENSADFLLKIANATHNYYSAWQRAAMKFNYFCEDYKMQLQLAQAHLKHLKLNISSLSDNQEVQSDIDAAILDAEAFLNDKAIRDFLLSLHKAHFEVKNYKEIKLCNF